MNYALLTPSRLLLLVAALTVLALWNVAPAGAAMSIGPSNGVLRITGDGQDDKIVLKVDSSDPSLLAFDFDNDRVFEGTVPLGSFDSIVFNMGAGNDFAAIDDRDGSFTDKKPTAMFGGDGDDFLQGGKGAESLLGGGGNDTVFWNAGGGNDVISGDAGSDKVVVRGTSAGETVTASSSESHVHVTLDSELVDLNGVEDLDVLTFDGNDGIIASAGVGTLIKLNLNAGSVVRPDDDVVIGSDSEDVIAGGLGVDRLEGRGGDDLINAGDGSDTLLGGTGKDAMTGGPGADSFECDVVGEALDLESVDFTQGTCSAPETPPVTALPVSDQPAASAQPAVLGFGRPVIRATREGLRVTLRNTSAAALGVSVKVAERFGSSRTFRYRVVRKTIPVGGRVALRLRAPRPLRARIARQLDRLGRVVRRPRVTVTNVATAGRLSVRPRLTLRAR
jgi:Ca2+-binding RTX toxin-like protein